MRSKGQVRIREILAVRRGRKCRKLAKLAMKSCGKIKKKKYN